MRGTRDCEGTITKTLWILSFWYNPLLLDPNTTAPSLSDSILTHWPITVSIEHNKPQSQWYKKNLTSLVSPPSPHSFPQSHWNKAYARCLQEKSLLCRMPSPQILSQAHTDKKPPPDTSCHLRYDTFWGRVVVCPYIAWNNLLSLRHLFFGPLSVPVGPLLPAVVFCSFLPCAAFAGIDVFHWTLWFSARAIFRNCHMPSASRSIQLADLRRQISVADPTPTAGPAWHSQQANNSLTRKQTRIHLVSLIPAPWEPGPKAEKTQPGSVPTAKHERRCSTVSNN